MLMPTLSRYMTRQPWTIGKEASMAQAHKLMRQHEIRHLPVLEGGKLVGLVSERDLHLMSLPDTDPEQVSVEDAMVVDIYAANSNDPVDVIVEQMARRKYGSVVVLDRCGGIEGIFTTVDALEVLADVLRRATA